MSTPRGNRLVKTIAYRHTLVAPATLCAILAITPACSESGSESQSTAQAPAATSSSSAPPAKTTPDDKTLSPNDLAQTSALANNTTEAAKKLLEGRPLEAITPLVGAWEIDAEWEWGQKLWGRSTFEVTLEGGWVEARSVVADAGADPYHRYTSLIGYDAEKDTIVSVDFTSDGSVKETAFVPTDEGGFETRWSMGDVSIRETILPTGETYEWDVWMQQPGSDEWSHVMDDAWKRTSESMPRHSLPELDDGLAVLEPLLGEWLIDAEWTWGARLRARSTYSKDVGGRFIKAATYPTEGEDGEEGEYHRYLSFFQAIDTGIRVHGFVYDGTKAVDELDVISIDPPIFEITREQNDGSELRQRVEMTSPNAYRWQVWNRPGINAGWSVLMDGVWNRVGETADAR